MRACWCSTATAGTGGALDQVLAEEGVERIPVRTAGAFYSGLDAFLAQAEAEPACFYLTDYLVRHFERLIIQGLGLDRYPELLPLYFGNYEKLVYLAQTPDPHLEQQAKAAALRLGLAYEPRPTGYGGLRDSHKEPADPVMAELIVVSWRDIPAQVLVKAGRRAPPGSPSPTASRRRSIAAMRAGLRDTDAYLGEWRWPPRAAAATIWRLRPKRAAARLEADYPTERLRALVDNGGLDPRSQGSSV